MRLLLLTLLLCACAFSESNLGVFTNSGDVGNPSIKGSVVYDAAKSQYRITGAGANMWAKEDQFQYVWKQMSGNFSVSATVEFLGTGADHRKAGIVLRQTLDTDSPYVDAIVHGNGMPGIQWRTTKGDITNGVDFPFDGPAKFTLKLVRRASLITVYTAKSGSDMKELAHTQVALGSPLLVGLAVCSHQADKQDTVVFSNVSLEALQTPPPAPRK